MDSMTGRPPSSVQSWRRRPGATSVVVGEGDRPCTSAHCRALWAALAGTTVVSASPCQIEILGHGPSCAEAARTRSPHSRAGRRGDWNIACMASCTLDAAP